MPSAAMYVFEEKVADGKVDARTPVSSNFRSRASSKAPPGQVGLFTWDACTVN